MYKKVVLSIIASIFSLALTGFSTPVQALDCIENCEEITVNGYAWAGEDMGVDEAGTTVTTSDDAEIEEVDIEEEVEEEPAMWPVYLSLGAIGVTFLLIIIINLTGRKYNKK